MDCLADPGPAGSPQPPDPATPVDHAPPVPPLDFHADLHRCARRLADAVTEFDAALADGVSLSELVQRDLEVTHAENACVAAATRLRSFGG